MREQRRNFSVTLSYMEKIVITSYLGATSYYFVHTSYVLATAYPTIENVVDTQHLTIENVIIIYDYRERDHFDYDYRERDA